jgi:hypothetical protein
LSRFNLRGNLSRKNAHNPSTIPLTLPTGERKKAAGLVRSIIISLAFHRNFLHRTTLSRLVPPRFFRTKMRREKASENKNKFYFFSPFGHSFPPHTPNLFAFIFDVPFFKFHSSSPHTLERERYVFGSLRGCEVPTSERERERKKSNFMSDKKAKLGK